MLPDRLAQIRQRVEAATEGPWAWTKDYCVLRKGPETTYSTGCEIVLDSGDHGIYPQTEGNEAFIAHSRTDVEYLLTVCEVLLGALQHIQKEAARAKSDECLNAKNTLDVATTALERVREL